MSDKKSNGVYTDKHLDRVAFPLGGIGAGMICIEGQGKLSHISVNTTPGTNREPKRNTEIRYKIINREFI